VESEIKIRIKMIKIKIKMKINTGRKSCGPGTFKYAARRAALYTLSAAA